MGKRRTLFYAEVNGCKRVLFSVKQGDNTDLTIVSEVMKRYIDNKNSEFDFDNQHYSVHCANEGNDTLITQKTKLFDGSHRSNTAYIHQTAKHLLWPVFARRVPSKEIKLFKPRDTDRIICLSRYRCSRSILMYSVFVTKPPLPFIKAEFSDASVITVPFDRYILIVISTFLNIPSPDRGDVVMWGTSTTVIDNVRDESHVQVRTESLNFDHMYDVHKIMMDQLRASLMQFLPSLLPSSGPARQLIDYNLSFYTRKPILPVD